MISAVLDTNVLASGTLSASTPPGQILDAWRDGRFEFITSLHIISELQRTFQKPYFQKCLGAVLISSYVDLLQNEATVVPGTSVIHGATTHGEDDLILATVVSEKADYLVTGDGPLLRKVGRSYRGIKLCTPSEFVEIIGF